MHRKREIVKPVNGGIHYLILDVDESVPWRKAVLLAGSSPNLGTPEIEPGKPRWDINALGDNFQIGSEKRQVNVLLANFGPEGTEKLPTGVIRAWGNKHELPPAPPRVVLAIGAWFPDLRKEIGWDGGKDGLFVTSLEEFRPNDECLVCGVRWQADGKRGAGIRSPRESKWCFRTWHAFVV